MPIRGVFVDSKNLYLVSEYIADTHRSLTNLGQALTETQISVVAKQILQVLEYLHEKKVSMQNLHPNNVFVSNGNNGDILITDVGFGQIKGQARPELSVHNDFLAPELSNPKQSNYDITSAISEPTDQVMNFAYMNDPEAVDIWSLGIIVKFLATGNTSPILKPMCQKGTPYSSELVDFLQRTLCESPGRRMVASRLLKHPFITKRRDKIHDLDGSGDAAPVREV